MRNGIVSPNLPDEKVGLVLVKREPALLDALEKLGIRALSPEKESGTDEEVSEHADTVCCAVGGNRFVVSPGQKKLKAELESLGCRVLVSAPLSAPYPGDVLLNAAVTESFAVGNFQYTDPVLLEALSDRLLLRVKQGYAKCSLCFVTQNAVITEDEGIARAMTEYGADVLEISKGDVYLSEKHYGFFGGASGKLSKTELAVTGSLRFHRDGERIRDFAEKHGVKLTELTDGVMKDVGGIIPLR